MRLQNARITAFFGAEIFANYASSSYNASGLFDIEML